MLIKRFIIVLCATLGLFSTPAQANFGIGPCCAGFVCGIIPCDTSCAGAAFNNMGASLSTSISTLNAGYSSLTQALSGVNNSHIVYTEALGASLIDQHTRYLQGMSANANRLTLAYQQAGIATNRNTDTLITGLHQALKELLLAKTANENNTTYDQFSQPLSGDILSDQVDTQRALSVNSELFIKQSLKSFNDYLNDTDNTRPVGSTHIIKAKALTEFVSDKHFNDIFAKNLISGDDMQYVFRVLSLLVEQRPLPSVLSGQTTVDKADFQQRRLNYNLQQLIVFEAIINLVASKLALTPAPESEYYYDPDKDLSGKTSQTEHLNGHVINRLVDPEWYNSIKKLNVTGLRRELTYQQAQKNMILMQQNTLKKQQNRLLALSFNSLDKPDDNPGEPR